MCSGYPINAERQQISRFRPLLLGVYGIQKTFEKERLMLSM